MGNPYYTIQPGISSVGSYQMSGIPFATSSITGPPVSGTPLEIKFPNVSKFVVVKNVNPTAASLRVGFSEDGIKGTNYFLLDKGESFGGDIRITKLYLLSNNGTAVSASVVAGLTGIAADNLPDSWSGYPGVG